MQTLHKSRVQTLSDIVTSNASIALFGMKQQTSHQSYFSRVFHTPAGLLRADQNAERSHFLYTGR